MTKPVVLTILDGWGIAPDGPNNAVFVAKTPNFDHLMGTYPSGQLKAHGNAVGLPEGQMGNSEVGHTTIGAGRVVWMDLPKIDREIESGDFFDNRALRAFAAELKETGKAAHIAGLVSDGGVHAHERHIAALARALDDEGVAVNVHILTDGRDVAPKSAASLLPKFLKSLPKNARVASVSGRFYAMDRDTRWDRVEAAYRAIFLGDGNSAPDAIEAVERGYASGESDEFITPTIIGDYAGMEEGDGFVFANFRADRAREILSALGAPDFDGFERPGFVEGPMLGMVNYSEAHDAFMKIMYPKEQVQNTIGEWVSKEGMAQFRVAETEKYPHVTFFMNGGRDEPHKGEARHLAPSPKVRTYDLQPEMSAPEVGAALETAIRSGKYGLIICNFANPDMVGHTGDLAAAVKACEAVDAELGRAIKAVEEMKGAMIVTADHGNCDMMVDPETGGAHTAHTLNPVPYIVMGHSGNVKSEGGLSDLAPTLLALMGVEPPADMSGASLLS